MTRLLYLLVFGLGIVLAGCGKKEFRDAGAGPVRFADSGVSIDVGTDWRRIDSVPEGMCSPTLAGKAGLIQAYWARPEFQSIDAIIAQAKKNAPGKAGEEKEFRSAAGVQGKSYSTPE